MFLIDIVLTLLCYQFFPRCAVPNAAKFKRITEVSSATSGAGLTPKELKWRQVFDVVDIMDTLVLYRKSVAKEFIDLAGNFNLEFPRIAQQHEVFDIIDRCHHQVAHGKTFLTWKRVNQLTLFLPKTYLLTLLSALFLTLITLICHPFSGESILL